MSYRRIILVIVGMALGGALIGGCGGEDDASADVTKAQFVKEAEAICADRKKEWEAVVDVFIKENEAKVKKTGKATSTKEGREKSQEILDKSLLPLLQGEQEELEALESPEADEAKVEEMLQKRAEGIETLEDEGVNALSSDETFGTFDKDAKAYGLNCSLY